MDHNDDFEQWRCQGVDSSKLPDSVKHQLRRINAIPTPTPMSNDTPLLLNLGQLTIGPLVTTTLPATTDAANCPYTNDFSDSTALFSKELPSNQPGTPTLSTLTSLVIPSSRVVLELFSQVNQRYLDGCNSIQLPGVPGRLPLWVPALWTSIITVYKPLQVKWKEALAWLNHPGLRDHFAMIYECQTALESLHPLSTLSFPALPPKAAVGNLLDPHSLQVKYLDAFLARSWLSDDHVDLMHQCLVSKIHHSSIPDHPIQFISPTRYQYICQAFNFELYNPSSAHPAAVFGCSLSQDSEIAGIFHVDGQHWVAVVVNIKEQSLLYGDPMGYPGAERVQAGPLVTTLEWFLSQHVSFTTFSTIKPLSCMLQDVKIDSWNCGIYSFDALARHFLNWTIPVSAITSAEDGDISRISVLHFILNHAGLITHPVSHTATATIAHRPSCDQNR